MEEELNYLSQKIEDLESEIIDAEMCQESDELEEDISHWEGEKQLLENILSALTTNVLNK